MAVSNICTWNWDNTNVPIKPDSTTTSCIQKKKTTTYDGIEDVLV